jgi:predicted ATP-binding protein involved in virulence
MRLEQLQIKNYRCFSDLTINFHPQLTVLIAPNGSGKTTILDAARVALWPFVKGFDLGSQTGKGASIQLNDVRLARQESGNMEPQVPSVISARGSFLIGDESLTWAQTRERMKAGTSTLGDSATKAITALGKKMEASVRAQHDTAPLTLPLVTYLGTSRLWYEGRFTSEAEDIALDTSAYSRTSGYLNCLSYSSSFKAFTAWYGWIYRSYRENQMEALEKQAELSEMGQRFAAAIQVVKLAVDALVREATGWHSLEYSASHNQNLVMSHDRLGVMPVDMLSDGLRNAIAMVADLAFRAYKLNPHLGAEAALRIPGVALIDEVDMFLHPSWQQTILSSLHKAFPQVQFIVSTHSPQVLTSVDATSIRRLVALTTPESGQSQIMVEPVMEQTLGVASADVLASIMGVDPIPDVLQARQLAAFHALIHQNLHDSADGQAIRLALDNHFGSDHPVMRECDRLIRLQAFKQRLPVQRTTSAQG